MSVTKELKKKHKQIEVQVKSLTKKRLNDRTSESWKNLKELKKLKLQLKDKITRLS
jgi:hypothetical protein|tara:strand:- start:49 stop:216 length:168 start_codon:yes stop_codon:yes gene_type:complete